MYSFLMFSNKNIIGGEGVFISTSSAELDERFRILRNQGQSQRYNHGEIGFSYGMTNVSAAFATEWFRPI